MALSARVGPCVASSSLTHSTKSMSLASRARTAIRPTPGKLVPTHVPHLATCRAENSAAAGAVEPKKRFALVGDAMTAGNVICCTPDATVDEVLELLVENRITGLPVVDDHGTVVGVVSDFDLLALDALGKVNDDMNLFPEAEQTWQAFKEVKSLLAKSGGKRVKDVMTKKPITVTPTCDLDVAARILLSKKIRRLPVITEDGKLCGIISRSNIVKAALILRKAA